MSWKRNLILSIPKQLLTIQHDNETKTSNLGSCGSVDLPFQRIGSGSPPSRQEEKGGGDEGRRMPLYGQMGRRRDQV